MRSFLLIAAAVLAFSGTMVVETTDANAVVCARGVYRARLRRRPGSGCCAPSGCCLPYGVG